MRQMSIGQILLEAVLLRLQDLRSSKALRHHTNILRVTDLISRGKTGVVDCSEVPKNHVARTKFGRGELVAPIFEPFHMILMEFEEPLVFVVEVLCFLVLTLLGKELIENFRGAFHPNQTAIFGTIRGKVQHPLDT